MKCIIPIDGIFKCGAMNMAFEVVKVLLGLSPSVIIGISHFILPRQ
ncbi:MAG: hypothetical protein ACLUHA_13290 [Bacteroides stercoris]